jgi:hypothetical protein
MKKSHGGFVSVPIPIPLLLFQQDFLYDRDRWSGSFRSSIIHPAGLFGVVKFRKPKAVWQADHPKSFDSQLLSCMFANQSVLLAHTARLPST